MIVGSSDRERERFELADQEARRWTMPLLVLVGDKNWFGTVERLAVAAPTEYSVRREPAAEVRDQYPFSRSNSSFSGERACRDRLP